MVPLLHSSIPSSYQSIGRMPLIIEAELPVIAKGASKIVY
jgi:hypothetical protein